MVLLAVFAVIGVVALALGLLALRRRWLARDGGTFECSVRLRSTTPGAGWALGMARYNQEAFEWFRFFSYALGPRKTFSREQIRVVESREPDAVEAVALYAGQQVVTLEERTGQTVARWSLAMGRDSLTGMMSWLEAAPPRSESP
jgi:uncharacterized protein DUF2550